MQLAHVLDHWLVEPESERALCLRYASRVRAYGLRHLRDRALAEDFLQHVLMSVLQAVREGRVEDPARMDAYVLGTCRHAAYDFRRGDARRKRLAEENAALLPAGYDAPWAALDRRRLEDCLQRLEARDRAVVLATFVEDRDSDEIARLLELSAGNVRVIRHRALSRLQGCMQGGAP
jgi:RNA polymerase sigma-70 factor (ECF subfamily)